MRYLYRGATLGVFLFLFSTIRSYDDKHEAMICLGTVVPYEHQYQFADQQNQSDFGNNHVALHGVMNSYINSPEYQQASLQVAQEKKNKQKVEAEEHLEKFGATKEELWGEGHSCGIFSGTFDDVIRRICQMSVDKKQALAIWHEYCTQKRTGVWFLDGLKEEGRQKILKSFEKREKKEKQEKQRQDNLKKQEEQKRQQHYQYIYHENIIAFSDEQSPYLNDRQLALQQTKEDKYQQHEKSYDIGSDAQVLGVKAEQFEKLSGTLFQHQLFKEIAQCYKKSAKIVFEHQIRNSIFVPSILEFAQSSFQAVGCEQLALAMQLNDLCETLAETSLSCCKGVIGGMCNFVDTFVLHLDHTATSIATLLGKTMKFVGEAMIAADATEFGASYYTGTFEKEHCNNARFIQDAMDQCKVWYQKSSFQEKVQTGTEFVTDLAVHPALLHKISRGCWSFISRARDLRALENATTLVEEFGGVVEEIVQASQPEKKFVTTIGELEESMVSFTEAEVDVINNIKSVRFSLNLSEEAAVLKRNEILNQIDPILGKTEKLKTFLKDNSKFFVEIEGVGQNITIDAEHIFFPEIKYRWNYNAIENVKICEEFGLVGWHYGFLNEFQKSGLLNIVKKVVKNDCVYVECSWNYGKSLIKKTLYPEYWSRTKVLNVIKQAVATPYKTICKGNAESCLQKTLYSKVEGVELISYLKRESVKQEWCVKSSFINKDWILS